MNRLGTKQLTYKVHLVGGQDRLREMILYVSDKFRLAPRWGKTKLNKVLWRADFEAYAQRRVPVTGCPYVRLRNGPAPAEMVPVFAEMINADLVRLDYVGFGQGITEERIVPNVAPNLRWFSHDDLSFIDEAVEHFWADTAAEVSEASHGLAWASREDNDPMPYELAFFSERGLTLELRSKLSALGSERGWRSQ